MLTGVRVVAGVAPKSGDISISVTVFDPVLATMTTPVASLMATPAGLVPVETSGTASELVSKLTKEAVPAVLLATTAMPNGWLIATPCGVAPTAMELRILPKLGFCTVWPLTVAVGLISTTEMLLQPLLVTTAIGENGPFTSWSAMATELGRVPPVVVQIWDKSTA